MTKSWFSVSAYLSRQFYNLGINVGKNPKCFILVSIVMTFTLGSGLIYIKYEHNIEQVYTVKNGPSIKEREIFEKYFGQEANLFFGFDPSRVLKPTGISKIIITSKSKTDANILTSNTWKEIQLLDSLIHNVTIVVDGIEFKYSDLCDKFNKDCLENGILELGQIMESIENGSVRLSYPYMFNPVTFKSHAIAMNFGGISFINSYTIHKCEALQLGYFVTSNTEVENHKRKLWQDALIKVLIRSQTSWNYIIVHPMTFESIIQETEQNIDSVMPQFGVTLAIMVVFAAISTIDGNWKSSKPFVALFGILSAFLGGVSAFGLLSYSGVPCAQTCMSIPFILLGIGVDDCFVLLSAWRRTSEMDSVPSRLALSYEEVGVSITITSLTDILSFFVGLLTPIESIQVFCAFAGASVFGIYVFQLIFFGAILALSGEQENGKRHSTIWFIVKPSSMKSDNNIECDKKEPVCNGRKSSETPLSLTNNNQTCISTFFGNSYTNSLSNKWVQIAVVGTYVIYIVLSCWSIQYLQDGHKDENAYNYNSYLYKFYLVDRKYFMKYPYRVQVAVTTPLDYSLSQNQNRIQLALQTLIDSSNHISREYKEDWLEDFLGYVERYRELYDFNITSEESFIQTLQNEFLDFGSVYNLDIIFNQNKSKILATRYILQAQNLYSSNDIKDMLNNLRDAVGRIRENFGLNVTIFHPWFIYADQILIIRPLTIKLVLVAAAIVMITTFIFIPNFISLLTVGVIGSIILGVLGLMPYWGMTLDFISLIVIVMCIGLCIDFSTHISYSYISCDGDDSIERIRNTLSALGLPILQGGLSTVIGVLGLAFASSYIFLTFLKIVFLCVALSIYHSLLVLPVLLILLRLESCYKNIVQQFNCSCSTDQECSNVNVLGYSKTVK